MSLNSEKMKELKLEEKLANIKRQEAEIKAKQQEKKMVMDHESREKEKDRRARLLEAEIKAAGYGAMQDMNKNNESDFQDVLKDVRNSEQYADTMNFNRDKETNKTSLHQQKLDLDREKMLNDAKNKQMEFAIARENKNKYDEKKPNN